MSCWLCSGQGIDGCVDAGCTHKGGVMDVARGSGWELRHGAFADVLAGETWDTLITDAPYSDKTHQGHDGGTAGVQPSALKGVYQLVERRSIEYTFWSPKDVQSFCAFAVPRTRGWCVSITDDVLAPVWADAFEAQGLYAFSPLAFLHPGSRVRLAGDGPAQWSVWIVVARPRREPFSKWGALPGGYVMPKGLDESEPKREIGGKPEWLMRELVKHYSKPGDRICDPCAGWSTTGVAALREGRTFIGSEIRREAFDKSVARLFKPLQVGLFVPPVKGVQASLLSE